MVSPSIQRINSTTKIKVEPSKTHVTLKIRGDDHDVYYRLQRDLPFHHMKLDYCNRLGLGYASVRFVYRGAALSVSKTANELQMKDGSVIDTWVYKIGG